MLKRLLVLLGLGTAYRGWNRRRRFEANTPYYGAGAGGALFALLAWLGWKNRDQIRSRLGQMKSGRRQFGANAAVSGSHTPVSFTRP
jgi:hypothetical protein